MLSYIFVALAVGGLLGYYLFKSKQELHRVKSSVVDFISTNEEMRDTLLRGLYHRYHVGSVDERDEDADTLSAFVARVMAELNGSEVYILHGSETMGVDMEESRGDGLYLGCVRCLPLEEQIGCETIAIVHSQIVKQNAAGGYVVTTSAFSTEAADYAEGLPIRLIEGAELVHLWVKSQERKKSTVHIMLKPSAV